MTSRAQLSPASSSASSAVPSISHSHQEDRPVSRRRQVSSANVGNHVFVPYFTGHVFRPTSNIGLSLTLARRVEQSHTPPNATEGCPTCRYASLAATTSRASGSDSHPPASPKHQNTISPFRVHGTHPNALHRPVFASLYLAFPIFCKLPSVLRRFVPFFVQHAIYDRGIAHAGIALEERRELRRRRSRRGRNFLVPDSERYTVTKKKKKKRREKSARRCDTVRDAREAGNSYIRPFIPSFPLASVAEYLLRLPFTPPPTWGMPGSDTRSTAARAPTALGFISPQGT